ncbi:MAG: exodeoxyribonuclease V subunit gamma [Synechococcus sp.]
MLTLYRSNRSDVLADVLAANLSLHPPGVLEEAQVVVNTWPTSRWLGEQLAMANPAGITANLRFPFPSSLLRQTVDGLLKTETTSGSTDPWRAQNLVWPLLDLLPELLEHPCSTPLQHWLNTRKGTAHDVLDPPLWQLARAMADAIDDYSLYRPAMLEAWLVGETTDARGAPLAETLLWQPQLMQRLHQRIKGLPFGLRARQLIRQLQQGWRPERPPQPPLRLFGISSLAPVQVELLQALSCLRSIELYLLTPCPDLWQRQNSAERHAPLDQDWLLTVPSFEARFGRLGAEFQQLLEGSGETQLGGWRALDPFFFPATVAQTQGVDPTLLEQLQEHLIHGTQTDGLPRPDDDRSLQFHACPGRMRQLQVLRDQILQLLANDDSLEPRDILVMTPQVEAFAPLVGAVFGDNNATGVRLPWRLTDRSQESEAGITQVVLQLLALGGERLTASALETVLTNAPLLDAHQLQPDDAEGITQALQQAGFRWGLDGHERGGTATHSLGWAIDRLVLGVVYPEAPGLALGATAPMALTGSLEQQGRWLGLLRQLQRSLQWLGTSRSVQDWVEGLRQQLHDLFGDGGDWAWEVQTIHAALTDWQEVAGCSNLRLSAPVVGEVLAERLIEGSGRFGHRSGALTISALEPMRAIPHKVLVLMGLDAGVFPRQRQRPGFHLMEQQRLLGDPSSGDQDRYVLLEAVLSARQHLLVSWSCRDERTGEPLEASTPVRQWLDLFPQVPVQEHAANALERSNFLPSAFWPPASCDQRLLQVRQHLDARPMDGTTTDDARTGLAFSTVPTADLPTADIPTAEHQASPLSSWDDLVAWTQAPQQHWLEQLGLRPKEHNKAVLDLEDLSLDERQRSALLRRELQRQDPSRQQESNGAPDWIALTRGQGLLPPQSAGALEAQQLDQRWHSLHSCLASLGEERRATVQMGEWQTELPLRDQQLVVIHTARPRSPQRQQLWLELLLATAAGCSVRSGVLVGHDGHHFRVLESIAPPSRDQSVALLDQHQSWRAQFQQRCWPLPPETGWAFAMGETKGRGWSKARDAWEGNAVVAGERLDAVQQLCFGSDLPLSDLLTDDVQTLALALHAPLLKHRQEVKG